MTKEDAGLVRLSNGEIEISVLAHVGAKIYGLIDRATDQNFLWHNPRIQPQPYPVDGNFDNYWCGGWDDGFPTCEPCTYKGEAYSGLGELRSVTWRVEEPSSNVSLRLSAEGPISPVHAEKTVKLVGRSVHLEYVIRNEGYAPLDYIWGTHPAFNVEPGCRLHIPSQSALVGQANPAYFGEPGQRYRWPLLETPAGRRDMSVVPEPGNHSAGHLALSSSSFR